MPEALRDVSALPRGGDGSPHKRRQAREIAIRLLGRWAGQGGDAVLPAYRALLSYVRALEKAHRHRGDPRLSARTHGQLTAQLQARRTAAIEALDPIVGAGLRRREGAFVLPAAVVRPTMLDDWIAWRFITGICLPLLGVPEAHTRVLSVCEGCTAVFRPAKKSRARYCSRCAHRPPPPPLGLAGRLIQPGDRATIRVPRLVGHAVLSWGRITLGRCQQCGELYFGRRDRLHCSERCEVAARRHSQDIADATPRPAA
jgi:hypothetical protein